MKQESTMNFPDNLKYTKDHEWLRIEDGVAVVGITDYAQSELGDIVFIEFPEKGKSYSQNDSMGTIEAVKTVADLFAPVSGEIVEVNEELSDNPELVNKDPYDKGWMLKMKISDPSEADALMDSAAYKEHVAEA
jgi:glycine cleavage system H protein